MSLSLFLTVSDCLSFSLPAALVWDDAAGPFWCDVWHEKIRVTHLQIEVSQPLSFSDARRHWWDLQVISQLAGSPGVILVRFTDKSDTVRQKTRFPNRPLSRHALVPYWLRDENQHCRLYSAAETKCIKLTWIFTHSPSGICWSWTGLSSNSGFQNIILGETLWLFDQV